MDLENRSFFGVAGTSALNGISGGDRGLIRDPGAADASLLDAYSTAVTNAVDRISPSVVHIAVHQAAGRTRTGEPRERQGGGSGFVFTPGGLVFTQSPVGHEGARGFAPLSGW